MSNASTVKKRNTLRILRALRQQEHITKSELVKLTGLNQSTVNNLMNELSEKGIITEEGIADSNGGRRASLFSLNADCCFIIAVDIGDTYITSSVFNFNLKEICGIHQKFVLRNHSVEDGLEKINAIIHDCVIESGLSVDEFAGIGISVSGPVDFANGKIYKITDAPKWKNIPLAKMIKQTFGIDTFIDKDNNAAVLYYKLFTRHKKDASMVFLSTQKGIGTGFLLDGIVYRGRHCQAGEIGHIQAVTSGELCKCGKIGCIESLASNPGIVNFYLKRINDDNESITLSDIVRRFQAGDENALIVLRNAAENISVIIGNIIKTYDPDEIILDAVWLKECSDIYKELINNVYEDNEFINRDQLKITLNTKSEILLYGAASLVIDYNLDSYDSKLL